MRIVDANPAAFICGNGIQKSFVKTFDNHSVTLLNKVQSAMLVLQPAFQPVPDQHSLFPQRPST